MKVMIAEVMMMEITTMEAMIVKVMMTEVMTMEVTIAEAMMMEAMTREMTTWNIKKTLGLYARETSKQGMYSKMCISFFVHG